MVQEEIDTSMFDVFADIIHNSRSDPQMIAGISCFCDERSDLHTIEAVEFQGNWAAHIRGGVISVLEYCDLVFSLYQSVLWPQLDNKY